MSARPESRGTPDTLSEKTIAARGCALAAAMPIR
jgi:hypothetical protein